MEEKHLHHPLHPLASSAYAIESFSSTTGFVGVESNGNIKIISSKFGLLYRLFFILSIVVISVWASHKASKGFEIMVVNNMKDTPTGEKFTLFYVSNDEAIRLVQSCSDFAAKILFPSDNNMPQQLIDQVAIQLVGQNLTNDHTIDVKSYGHKRKHLLYINSLVMEYSDFKYRIKKEIQRGMAEILLFDQRHKAPRTLLDGMVEYISDMAGFGSSKPVYQLINSKEKCWENKDPRVVAKFLAYCEVKSKGCVGRLNQEMNRDDWYEEKMDRILGFSAMNLCQELIDLMSEDMIYRVKL